MVWLFVATCSHRPPRRCNASNFIHVCPATRIRSLPGLSFSEMASFRISQTNEETHRYRFESIESKTPAHSLCDRGKESRPPARAFWPCFISIWLAHTTDFASSSDCGKLASVRLDLRDDLSGKCLTAEDLSEGRDVDITTSAGKVSGIFHGHLARPRLFLDFGRACLGTPTSRLTIVFRILYASKLGSLAPCHPGPSITTRISPFSPFGAARRKINMVSTNNYAGSSCAIWDNQHSNKYRNTHLNVRAACCCCIRVTESLQQCNRGSSSVGGWDHPKQFF